MRNWTNGRLCLVTMVFSSALVSAILAGCAQPEVILDRSGPTMAELITPRKAPNEIVRLRTLPEGGTRTASLIPYTRTAQNEIEQLFPTLDNPTLTIYVYPHLSTASLAPIPGYTTAIKLYPADPFALPGERVESD